MAKKILVLVIEDNRLVRDGLVALLDAQPDFKLVAAAEGANVGLVHVREAKPHVVLVDAAGLPEESIKIPVYAGLDRLATVFPSRAPSMMAAVIKATASG